MINLLPESQKNELRSARANVVLLRYNIITIVAIILLGLFCALFYVILSSDKNTAIVQNEQSSAESKKYSDTRKQADMFKKDLALASKIFSKEVNYTDTIFAIASVLPQGVVLDSLDLNANSFGNETVFTAHAKDQASVTRLKDSFQKSKEHFENAHFQTISDTNAQNVNNNGDKAYPITVNISVKIKKVTQ